MNKLLQAKELEEQAIKLGVDIQGPLVKSGMGKRADDLNYKEEL